MPEPSETSRDKESRPDPSGFFGTERAGLCLLWRAPRRSTLSELWPVDRAPGVPQSGQLH
eukprot:341030-Pleurochrysis_carterae.AAC.1